MRILFESISTCRAPNRAFSIMLQRLKIKNNVRCQRNSVPEHPIRNWILFSVAKFPYFLKRGKQYYPLFFEALPNKQGRVN